MALPSPPFYHVAGLENMRDAALAYGGLQTKEGKRVRPRVLFRSAEVASLDAAGWEEVHALGVAHVFDLRSKPEVDKGWAVITGESAGKIGSGWEDSLSSVGVGRTWVPVFEADDYSPERLAKRTMKYLDETVEGFVAAYHDILTHAGPSFRTILLYLASLPSAGSDIAQEKPLGALVHCTAGKDRTGIFFGLLLSFLGVPDDQIAAEYQLTEQGLSHILELVVPRLLNSPAFQKYAQEQQFSEGGEGGEKRRQAALRMLSAKRESMLGSLAMLRREWGGAEGYMRTVCGLGDEELESLKRNLIVDA